MAGYGYGHDYGYGLRNCGKNKSYWTHEEDTKLVDALMELHVSGMYVNAEINPEYAQAVKPMMDPYMRFSAKPIKARMKTFKTNLDIVHDMLVGTHMSGFSWDSEKMCVIADDQVWDEYIKTHENAAQFRYKPFPFYDKLCIILGKDKATGFQANGFVGEGVVGENQMTPCVETKNVHVGGDVFSSYGVIESVGGKRKRDEDKDLSETCVESVVELKNTIGNFGGKLIEILQMVVNEGVNAVNAANDIMDKVMTNMKDLSGLTLDERLLAMSVIGGSATLAKMFDMLDRDGKIRMAQMVVNGSIR